MFRPHPRVQPSHASRNEALCLRITPAVVRRIMLTIAAAPPETGGILLGPIGTDDITDYHYDEQGRCGPATYSPDHVALGRKMREEWIPSGIDMKGFTHSHPGRYDSLSAGDLDYIGRLLRRNPDMSMFAAPIVLPSAFRICPWVVLRDDPRRPRRAELAFTAPDARSAQPLALFTPISRKDRP